MIIRQKRITKSSPSTQEVIEKKEMESKTPLFRKKEFKEKVKKEARHMGNEFFQNMKALVSPDFRTFSIIGSIAASKTLESGIIKGIDPTEKTPVGKAVNVTKKVVTAPVKVVAAPVKMIKNTRNNQY